MGRQIHAQTRNTNRLDEKRFRGKRLVTQVLKIKGSGKEFSALVPENASVDEAIEAIARQNDGKVEKRYYREMGAYEITEIRIGDQLITKDKTGGIHWFIDDNKIPIAVDGEGNIEGFLNGEEAKVGRNVISIGLESSTADPKSIEELQGNMRRVESAHAGEREKDPDLKDSEIILFDKETGELTPMCPCQEAESFDYSEISMEKIFVSEISAVENKNPVFENCPEKGMGEIFYSYIEIIDAKESIVDRVTLVSEPVEMPVAASVGAEQVIEQTTNEEFSTSVSDAEYIVQPIMVDPAPATPKPRDSLLRSPDYFQDKPMIKKHEETKGQKIRIERTKLFRYPPKIEKIEITEVKKTETYSKCATAVEMPAKEFKVQRLDGRFKTRSKTKRTPGKKKRKRRKVAEITKKTSVKIKKVKAEIEKLIKKRKHAQILKKPKVKPVSKKKADHKPKVKPVKTKKKKAEVKNQFKIKKKKPKRENRLLKQPGKEVKQKRNKSNNHKRLHHMLV